MVLELSIVICTHNPRRDYLRRVLTALQGQTMPRGQWELLLIDNASKERLGGSLDLSWHSNARHVREDELGLTPARLRGIRESIGDILVFVDDDNVLAVDYLAVAARLAATHPQLGCFGAGVIAPEFESLPAQELSSYLPYLALRDERCATWSNVSDDGIVPWGAGLVVKRPVAECYARATASCAIRQMLDRRGQELTSGGDVEFSWLACQMGFGKGVFPELNLTHLIPSERVQKDYLLNLVEAQTFSGALLSWIHGTPMPVVPKPASKPAFLKVLRALLALKASRFWSEGNLWWNHRHDQPAIIGEYESARHRGVARAEATLRQMQPIPGGTTKGGGEFLPGKTIRLSEKA